MKKKKGIEPDQVIEHAIKIGASDVKFQPLRDSLRIKMKLDGIWYNAANLEKEEGSRFMRYLKERSGTAIDDDSPFEDLFEDYRDGGRFRKEPRFPFEGGFFVDYKNREIGVRVEILPTIKGDSACVRILDPVNVLPLDEIGMSAEHLGRYKELIGLPDGLILVTGPTGVGKTTTVYASLKHLDPNKFNIFTLEDPTEYPIEGIDQISVDSAVGENFGNHFAGVLRSAPDVLYSGEIRAYDVAETVFRAAGSGSLVFGTTHSRSSEHVPDALRNTGVEAYVIGSTVKGIVSQRLVRKLCGNCKTDVKATDPLENTDIVKGHNLSKLSFPNKKGCNSCNHTGYKGRAGVFEVLGFNDDIIQDIYDGASSLEIRRTAVNQKQVKGYLGEEAIDLIRGGVTSVGEVERVFGKYDSWSQHIYTER